MVRITRTCRPLAVLAALVAAGTLSSPVLADTRDPLAAYVRARAADAGGQAGIAAMGYAEALAASPGNAVIAIRAYREALAAGDMVLIRRAIAVMDAAGVAPVDTRVLNLTDAVRAGDWARADAIADRLADTPLAFLIDALKGWIAFGRGAERVGGAPANDTPLARRFTAESGALLLIAGGRYEDADATLRPLLGAPGGNADLRYAAAQLLAGRGQAARAQALLAGDDPMLVAMRAALGKGVRPSAGFGIALLLTRLAGDIADGDAHLLAIVLERGALELDPANVPARVVLAQALAAEGAVADALATLQAIPPDGPFHLRAQAMRIALLSRAGETDRAIAAAAALSRAPTGTSDDAQRYGDLLASAGHYGEAADAYGVAIDRIGANAGWALYLQHGGALDQAGRWQEAREQLRRAVALAPDEPAALNYLGYAEIQRGENLPAARAMLEKAAGLKPQDANIADSLGWAYVRAGDVRRGLPLLERAARALPGNSEVNDHLGDAYWLIGRRYEARYAWRAASVTATSAERALLSAKLATGPAS